MALLSGLGVWGLRMEVVHPPQVLLAWLQGQLGRAPSGPH